jgi:hypothetical protein
MPDPLSRLRNIAEPVRAYYYRIAVSSAPLAALIAAALGHDPLDVVLWSQGALGFIASLLAVANTGTNRQDGPT